MNKKVKVLALDNSNRVAFVTIDSFFRTAEDFMKQCLLAPHEEKYEVRQVIALDLTDQEVDMFDLLDDYNNPPLLFVQDFGKWMRREKAFNYFWAKGTANEFYT